MNWPRFALWGGLTAALATGLIFAFRPQAVPVDLATVERGPLMVTIDEEAETRVRDVFVLSAPVAGRLRRIENEAGDPVVAGETVVARIEPADPSFLDARSETQARAAAQAAESALELARAELDKAVAEDEFAAAELRRAETLFAGNTISRRALDDARRLFKTRSAAVATARAAVAMRQSELAAARARLVSPIETQGLHDNCVCINITAPVSGRVLRLLHESEGVVRAGEPLVEIGDPRALEIVADLLSSDAVRVQPGQAVIIEEWGGPAPLAGAVRRIEPFGFTRISALGIEEQRVNVIIAITDPPERRARLGHGYRVETRIVLWRDDDVLKAPLTSLFRNGADWALFVNEDGRARRRAVTPGRNNGIEAQITEGVAVGERVVLHPGNRITDGVRIVPR